MGCGSEGKLAVDGKIEEEEAGPPTYRRATLQGLHLISFSQLRAVLGVLSHQSYSHMQML
jgi:hypothetical protein